jgi:hypothetical protein
MLVPDLAAITFACVRTSCRILEEAMGLPSTAVVTIGGGKDGGGGGGGGNGGGVTDVGRGSSSVNMLMIFSSKDGSLSGIMLIGGADVARDFFSPSNSDCLSGCWGRSGTKKRPCSCCCGSPLDMDEDVEEEEDISVLLSPMPLVACSVRISSSCMGTGVRACVWPGW